MHQTLHLLARTDFPPIARARLGTLQVNLGYKSVGNADRQRGEGVFDRSIQVLTQRAAGEAIRVADHCYGRTAGQGRSCGGALEANAPAEAA